jgi:hypothetical protein
MTHRFNIVLGNHPPHAILTTRDHTLIIKGGLEEIGHFAQLSFEDVFRDAINVFYDYLTGESPAYFQSLREKGYKYGLITTEILGEQSINYRSDDTAQERIEATKEIAKYAEFLWVMHKPSLENFKILSGNERCYYLPLGYTGAVNELRYLPHHNRDIDFLFFGYLTPYRKKIMDEIRSRGFVLSHIYNVPAFIRNSMIERSKINLVLRQNETWDQPSVGRISYLVTNRCAAIAEQTANGAPYEDYVIAVPPEDFVETCVRTISDDSYWVLADTHHERFKKNHPVKSIMKNLVEKTFS